MGVGFNLIFIMVCCLSSVLSLELVLIGGYLVGTLFGSVATEFEVLDCLCSKILVMGLVFEHDCQ